MADESHATAEAAMRAATEHGGVVPVLWWYEIRHALDAVALRPLIPTRL